MANANRLMRKKVIYLFTGLAVALGVLVLGLRLLETRLIYIPWAGEGLTPAAAGLPHEDVLLETPDGEKLNAWWIPRPEAEAPLLLFFHGNAGSREHRLHNLQLLWQAGISVLIFDYRGYGGSTGKPSEPGLIKDGLTAHDWLVRRFPGRPIAYFGRSLGGAVAARVALERQPQRLILESVFTSVPEMAGKVFPIPGIGLLAKTQWNALNAIGKLEMPLLMIHGDADEVVPYAMGQQVFKASAAKEKAFHTVPGGRHNDTYVVAGNAYKKWLTDFLNPGE